MMWRRGVPGCGSRALAERVVHAGLDVIEQLLASPDGKEVGNLLIEGVECLIEAGTSGRRRGVHVDA